MFAQVTVLINTDANSTCIRLALQDWDPAGPKYEFSRLCIVEAAKVFAENGGTGTSMKAWVANDDVCFFTRDVQALVVVKIFTDQDIEEAYSSYRLTTEKAMDSEV
jgi:hypothetical protein